MADSPFIFEANENNFAQAVLQNSYKTLVVVDFWADWCQPCKALMPILAKLAEEYQGGFVLVKVNSDQNKRITSQYGVRNLPTVKFFKNGQIVDEFMGAQPESAIRKLINKHRVRKTEAYRQQALMMYEQGDVAGAVNLLQQVVQHEPDFYEAMLELAGLLLDQGELEAAESYATKIPAEAVPSEALTQLLSEIKLAKLQQQTSQVDTSALTARLEANAEDWDARLELAKVWVGSGQFEQGLEQYLFVMRTNPSHSEGAGRQGLLNTFELLGASHPLVKKYRGKMFSLLY